VYDTATQLVLATIAVSGLAQVTDMLVVPLGVYSLQTGQCMTFEKKVWAPMARKRANKVGNVKSCYMNGQTLVGVSERKLSSCSWCMNCRGTYVYKTSLFRLEGEDDLKPLEVEMQYGLVGPVLGIYLLSTQTWEMKWLGDSPIKAQVSAACMYQDRLYALYDNGSFLSVSVETGLGWVAKAEVWVYVWVIKKRLPRVTASILHEVLSLFSC